MEKLSFHGEEISHGFKVGIGTVAVAQLMDFVVRTPVTVARKMAAPLMSLEERKARIAELLKKDCYGTGIPEVALEKFLTGNAALERREQIFGKWEILQEKIRQQIFPVEEFRRLLRSAGAPDDYRQIGLDREQYCHGIRTAQLIRKRYTVLDLLFETGLLECAIDSLE